MKWKKLRKQIEVKQDIILFNEVIRCFNAKAYRMAYIATWIAIAESLKNKFKLMAEKDSAIDGFVKQIERLENTHHPVDKAILEEAQKIGILDELSYQKIEPILKMRNIYAHPYNAAPRPDEVSLAIKHAVENVLSTPPLLRKPYINDLLENLQKNRHYLDDLEEKVIKFTKEVIGRIAPDLYPYLLKSLFYRLNEVVNDPDRLIFANRLIWFTQTCMKNIRPDFTQSQWRLREKFNDFSKAVSKTLASVELWDLIPEDVQDSIISYLLFPEEAGIPIKHETWALKSVYLLFVNKKLTPRQEERVEEGFNTIEPEALAEVSVPLSYYAERLIKSLSSHNWYNQNPAASLLWNLGPMAMKEVSPDVSEDLGRNILQSADGDAGSSCYFLNGTLTSRVQWPAPFVKGLLYECFLNENNEFRCKNDNNVTSKAILIAIRCNEGDSTNLFDALLKDIDKSKPKDEFCRDYRVQEGVKDINNAIQELTPIEKRTFEDKLKSLSEILLKIKEGSKVL